MKIYTKKNDIFILKQDIKNAHDRGIRKVLYNSEGNIISCSYDKTIKIWELDNNGDYINVTGKSSLYNAIIIAIMTRFNELEDIPLYEDFGCRVHEVMKDHKSEKVFYNIEIFIANVLKEMRRIHEVNELIVTDKNNENYSVYFNVTSISDEIVSGEVEI